MKREPNQLKRTIADGGIALGTCICSFSPTIVEVAGLSGLVWCRIDNEHAWRQDESVEHVLRAAALSGIVPLVRVDKGEPRLVRKALEAGAGGVIVPHVQNARDAADIVQAAKFPPLGTRGFSSLCFSGAWGVGSAQDGLRWMEWTNRETLVIPMVEEPQAVDNIDEILAIEGVDAVFFGPSDYSVLAGVPLEVSHPKVVAAVSKTVDAARRRNKFVILGARYPWCDDVQRLVSMGIRAIEIGHDISVLSTVWKKTIEDLTQRDHGATRGKTV